MTDAEALRQLDALPYFWNLGKGRVVPDEPLWSVGLYRILDDGMADTSDAVLLVEGDSFADCVVQCVSWHKHQVLSP